MEPALAKIRPHQSSGLSHQKTPATLLAALESTFQDQKTEKSPTAYFAALLTTLDGTLQKKDIELEEGDVLPAELYLLALVIPFVGPAVIRANISTLLALTAPLFPALVQFAPPLRSQLTIYSTVFQALEKSQLEIQGIRQAFASILQLCLDRRPKVRRKAADVIKDVLASPPPPMSRHPYADRVSEWVKASLAQASAGVLPRSKTNGKSAESPATESAIHILAFLRPVLPHLPATALPAVTTALLSLPRLGNPYLSQSAYQILSDVFSAPTSDEDSSNDALATQISDVLKAVLSSPPLKSDITFSPSWIQVLGHSMLAFHVADPEACSLELGKVWKTVWVFLESNDTTTRKAATQSLDLLSRCFTSGMIESAAREASKGEARSTLGKILAQTSKAIDALAFARSMPELLAVIASLIANLGKKETGGSHLLHPLVLQIGSLRSSKNFEFKENVDLTLGMAMHVLGPEILLGILPLNLEPADRQAGGEPRAYLLPLLAQPHSSSLTHFVDYFVPLSERMFNLQQKAENEGRASEVKVWSVLIAQIWSGLSGYCHSPGDLSLSLTPVFSQLLSQLLYGQPDLRPAILKSLKIMVDSSVAAVTSTNSSKIAVSEALTPAQGAQNIAFLKKQAESWLAVFFNVFSSVDRDSRGMVGDVIAAWASIADEKEITKAYQNVVNLFNQNLAKPASWNPSAKNDAHVTATFQDLLVLLLPYLSPSDATALFQLCLTSEVLGARDNGVQKRGYKILSKLMDSGKLPSIDPEQILKKLEELSEGLAPAAKKDRFCLISSLVQILPSAAMHVIPSLIPEAVLGTKEPSEKARGAAFDVVLAMGRKMSEGGVVKRSMIDGMEEDDVAPADAVASVEEYMTMVAGGLAGASPHMISATVTAISRLVFEFKDTISTNMHTEIFTTLLVFLSSANREIVKSILGFIKLAIHTLPAELIQPHLPQLVPALLGWSHDHKNHFKAKVRHIFERMLRRFGWNDVYQCAGEEEAGKVLVNIKKRKERAKRKKNQTGDAEDEDETPAAKPAGGDAFEDVLYGSESELSDSDDEQESAQPKKSANRRADVGGARLRVDDDEPMDLLQGVASRITNSQSNKRRKPGQDAARFKTDEDSGKMIIDENDGESEGEQAQTESSAAVDLGGSAYRENITSVDGFTRGANGRVKFNKDTKKRRRDNEDIPEDEDVDMDKGGSAPTKKSAKRRTDVKLGHEFKAKRAGGDVKKGGVDPYAYMSLSQAAKKKTKIGIAGKR